MEEKIKQPRSQLLCHLQDSWHQPVVQISLFNVEREKIVFPPAQNFSLNIEEPRSPQPAEWEVNCDRGWALNPFTLCFCLMATKPSKCHDQKLDRQRRAPGASPPHHIPDRGSYQTTTQEVTPPPMHTQSTHQGGRQASRQPHAPGAMPSLCQGQKGRARQVLAAKGARIE